MVREHPPQYGGGVGGFHSVRHESPFAVESRTHHPSFPIYPSKRTKILPQIAPFCAFELGLKGFEQG